MDSPIDQAFDEDLQRRILHKIPPGYKDAAKDESGPGDLIIWKTILHAGQTRGKHVLFVTGEEKSDWWHRSADTPLYPRYELLDEYRAVSGGKTFHIMGFAELLERFGAERTVVEEVRREQTVVAPISAPRSSSPFREMAEHAVVRWLLSSAHSVSQTFQFPNFWVHETPEERPYGVEVILIGSKVKLPGKIDRLIINSREIRDNGTTVVGVLVSARLGDTAWASELVRRYLLDRVV